VPSAGDDVDDVAEDEPLLFSLWLFSPLWVELWVLEPRELAESLSLPLPPPLEAVPPR